MLSLQHQRILGQVLVVVFDSEKSHKSIGRQQGLKRSRFDA